ncbi:hypothetical protein HII31_07671 [Pseudocercospora fuligena]|uniref:Uncharacterized protein n=1 Tax=Pseudocercospora fuligena TaxID=685502 RepID=A0A8H6VK50_9PEZI|nr:hypothetical protein HII31_07671 [Pseudocercospora fuligena]
MLARSSLRFFRGLARYQSSHRHVASTLLRSIDPISGLRNRYFSASCRPLQAAVESREASDTLQAPSQRLGPKSEETENTPTVPITLTEFETLAKYGAATIDHARGCLEHLKAQLLPLALEERREAAAKTDAGRKILLWLWTEYGSDPAAFLHTGKARIGPDLCWFLLAQGLEEYLWKWIEREIPSAADLNNFSDLENERQRLLWTGPLLAGLLQAHYEWATDASLDVALKAFKKAREAFSVYGERGDKFVEIPFWTMSKITQDDFTCDASLYEILIDFHNKSKSLHRDLHLWRFRFGALALNRPSNPDPEAFLQWFRQFTPKVMRRYHPKARNANAAYMMKAAYILRHQMRADEATELERFVEKEARQVWSNRRKTLEDLDARRGLVNIRRNDVTIPW